MNVKRRKKKNKSTIYKIQFYSFVKEKEEKTTRQQQKKKECKKNNEKKERRYEKMKYSFLKQQQ
jgi:hypothetical protein